MKIRRILTITLLSILFLNIIFTVKANATGEITPNELNNNISTENENLETPTPEIITSQGTTSENINTESTSQETTNQEGGNSGVTNLGTANMNTEPQTLSLKAKVIEVGEIYIEEASGYKIKYQDIKVQVKDGEFKGQVLPAKYTISYDLEGKIEGYPLNKGNTIGIEVTLKDGKIDMSSEVIVNDIVRSGYLVWLLILFFAIILIVGRKQGIKAIVAFIITILAIFMFMLPQIIKGQNAILISIVTSIIVIVLSFIIISGFKRKSISAMIGTSGGVICAGIVALIFGILAKLSGAQEEAMYLSINFHDVIFNFKDLLFAGIVIASLGAAMDVGMSISSALDELKQKNPNMMAKELFKSGMNIGGDVIGTMTNTLILAYVGGAVTMVLLFMVNNMPLFEILNMEIIATDVVSALSASMGVIFTVPITAAAYALLNNKKLAYDKKSKNLHDGKRSLNI